MLTSPILLSVLLCDSCPRMIPVPSLVNTVLKEFVPFARGGLRYQHEHSLTTLNDFKEHINSVLNEIRSIDNHVSYMRQIGLMIPIFAEPSYWEAQFKFISYQLESLLSASSLSEFAMNIWQHLSILGGYKELGVPIYFDGGLPTDRKSQQFGVRRCRRYDNYIVATAEITDIHIMVYDLFGCARRYGFCCGARWC
jgi:hypothetical protein